MKKYFLFIIVLIINSACTNLLLHFGGMRKPKIENEKSVKNYLLKIKVDTSDVFTFDTNVWNEYNSKPFKPGWPPSYRPCQIRVYDRSGIPIAQWASCEGNIDTAPLFTSVPPKNLGLVDTTMTLKEELNRYCNFKGEKVAILPPDGVDYYLIIHFARYFPKLNKMTFENIAKYQLAHPGLKLKIYKINNDFQEFWNYEPEVTIEVH